jgi:alpha-tubulin suppressor-like RCC1 family protein
MLSYQRSILPVLFLVIWVACFQCVVYGEPIIFTFTATGNGSLEGKSFTNAPVTIAGFGDTTNVLQNPLYPQDAQFYYLEFYASTIGISNVGCGRFFTQKMVALNLENNFLLFDRAFSDGGTALFRLINPSFGTYDLKTNLGPIIHLSPALFSWDQVTSIGQVTLTSLSDVSVRAALGTGVAPQIVLSPTNETVQAGDPITLLAQVTGTEPFAFRWQRNGSNIAGAINPSLSLTNVQQGQSGDYKLVVTNLFGAVTSSVAIVTVTPVKPVFTLQPTSQSTILGTNITLISKTKGSEPIVWQWQLNGNMLDGATNTSLLLSNIQESTGGNYALVASNHIGVTTSIIATVTVVLSPSFTLQPVSQGAAFGSRPTFTAAALGSGTMAWQWYFNGDVIPGRTTPALSLTNVQNAQMGNYITIVSNSYGSATSMVATLSFSPVIAWGSATNGLTVIPSRATNISRLTAGTQHALAINSSGSLIAWGANAVGQTGVPANATNVSGATAGLGHSIALRADGALVPWGQLLDNSIPPGATNVLSLALGSSAQHALALRADGTVVAWGSTNFTLTNFPPRLSNIVEIAAGDSFGLALRGDGTVVGWGDNTYGQTSIPNFPVGLVSVAAGFGHSLGLRADGRPVAWGNNMFSQNNVPPSATNVIAIACGAYHNLALRGDGTIIGWGNNTAGQNTVPAWATNAVAIAATGFGSLALAGDGAPVVTSSFLDRSIIYGSNAVFRVSAAGSRPLTYQWKFNGTNLLGATRAILSITNAGFAEAGLYSVAVSNSLGGLESSEFALNVRPLVILSQPVSQSILAGTTATFSVVAGGQFPMTFQWRFNNSDLMDQTNSILILTNVQPNQAGPYSVRVGNTSNTTTSSNASLIVRPLTITAQPQNQSVTLGGTASFSVTASFQEPFSYQWKKDGNNVPGATNNPLVLVNLHSVDTGYYSVKVSNPHGETNSTAAHLSVLNVSAWPSNAIPSSLTNAIGIAAGFYHNLALKPDGTVIGWGSDSFGAIKVPRSVSNVVAIAGGTDFSAALLSNRTVIVWGYNIDGEQNVPVYLSNVVSVSCGEYHLMALKADGTLVAWGDNTSGQAEIPGGLSNVVAITCGGRYNLALKSDGLITAWGANGSGQTNVPALSNIIGISAGYLHGMALQSNGMVVCWGSNDYGQTNTPPDLSNVVAIAAGSWHSVALKHDGSVVGWGRNDLGQTTFPSALRAVAIDAGNYHSVMLLSESSPVLNAIISGPVKSANRFMFVVPTQSGRVYAPQFKHPSEADWTFLQLIPGSGADVVITDSLVDPGPRLYRVLRW